jgi:hypothetical protein
MHLILILQALRSCCKPWVTSSAASRNNMHRHVTKNAECIVPISERRGVNLKPPALAWAWLPENTTRVMYTWGQFSHMRPPPTSPAMQLHSTHGHNVVPPSAHQTCSRPTHAIRICCDHRGMRLMTSLPCCRRHALSIRLS